MEIDFWNFVAGDAVVVVGCSGVLGHPFKSY